MSDTSATDPHARRRLRDILASTVMVGGGSIVTVATGIIRSKVISQLAGPAGIGLQGLLQSALRTANALASAGVQASGIREIARLRGAEDPGDLGHMLRALRIVAFGLGALAAVVMLALRRPIARAVLDNPTADWMIAVIALGAFAQTAYGAYAAFLRGFRRVGPLTKATIWANVVAATVSVGLVAWFGLDGIAVAVIALPICTFILSAYIGRDFSRYLAPFDLARIRHAAGRLLRMGIVLAAAGMVTVGTQLTARIMVAHSLSIDDVGCFQAAWAISSLYLGFVLGAMSLDYYPALAEQGNDRAKLSQMINDQARVSFLLAGPAILGLLTLSRMVIAVLYTSKFEASVELLRWQLVGDVLKIGSWSLGYVVLARGQPRLYFFTELSGNVAYLIALTCLLPLIGVASTAAAYVASSAFYFVVLCVVTKRFAGFSWNRANIAMMVLITFLAAVIVCAQLLLPESCALAIGLAVSASFAVYSLRRLIDETGLSRRHRGKGRE